MHLGLGLAWLAAAGEGVEFLKKFTLQETNISPQKVHFEDDFPFPKVG